MKHSKHLTVLIAMLLTLLMFGIVFYLYLSALGQLQLSGQPGESSRGSNENAQESDLAEAEIRARLESVMGAQQTESDAASSSETFDRLNAVMGSQAEVAVEPDETRARLEAAMSNN